MKTGEDSTKRGQTCCFTGHRVIPDGMAEVLSQWLDDTVRTLIGQGYLYFRVGGALGFDTLAAEAVLRMREEFPHIRLILVLPCRDQVRGWKREDIVRYESIRDKADEVIYTSEQYEPGCMYKRNRHLVDYSGACVAYCTRSRGGTAYTVSYAGKCGCGVIVWGRG